MPLKSVLITGGNGNLGRLVADRFVAAGINVVSFDLPDTTPAMGVSACVNGDMRDTALLAETLDTHKPDAILHLASLLSGSSEADPAAAWEINASASVSLMQMAQQRDIGPFVFASTVATYAAEFPDHLPEDAPQWPANVYGATKIAVERMGVWLKKSAGYDFRCVRFPMVLSPFAPPGALTAYPSHAVTAAAQGKAFVFPVSPETGMSTLYLEDVTRSLFEFTMADATRLSRPAYNLHGFHFTARQLAEKIRGQWPDAEIKFAPDPKINDMIQGLPDMIEDASARAEWGWEPAYDFDGTFAALIGR